MIELTPLELAKVKELVHKVVDSIDDLTKQIYVYQIGWDKIAQIAGDVVIIAIGLGREDDVEGIKHNIIINWKYETVQRYSHPKLYRHFFN